MTTPRSKYEDEIIQAMYDICRPKTTPPMARMSDSDRAREYIAIARFKLARHVFEETLRDGVLPLTSLRADRVQDILDMLEDASPDIEAWEEKISEACK